MKKIVRAVIIAISVVVIALGVLIGVKVYQTNKIEKMLYFEELKHSGMVFYESRSVNDNDITTDLVEYKIYYKDKGIQIIIFDRNTQEVVYSFRFDGRY